ncbi:protein expanded isoform X3 [Cloeon dipterum]|uniref:protein expanded isoform X3 n=1 Tax=Cloeon dipterum TaxID=197152 RepID=UPI0032204A45
MRRASSAAGTFAPANRTGVPVETCSAPLSTPALRYAAVNLLTGQPLYFIVEAKSRVKDLLSQARRHLAGMGMLASELLGLAVMQDGEWLFLDPESKLAKFATKQWKSPTNFGLDCEGNPALVLNLRVQFYVESPLLLRDPISRLHYYLQLRENLLQPERVCPSEEQLLQLLGYALQADLSDFDVTKHKENAYFNPTEFVPKHAVERMGADRLVCLASEMHLSLRGTSTSEAQVRFINEACSPQSSLNLQLHRLQRVKREVIPSAWLGVGARGIDIFEQINDRAEKEITASFPWVHIARVGFDRKKFEVRGGQNGKTVKKYFYTGSAERSCCLLHLCRSAHQYVMSLGPRLAQLRLEQEEAERRRLRYCSLVPRRKTASNDSDLLLLGSKALRSEQRESVISSASSNTTSGIVSDRVLSFDESEDDLEREIMINSPPVPIAISSVESLALDHLQDQEEPTDDEDELEDEVDSPPAGPQSPGTPGAAEGSSQCSSSGSTIKHAKEVSAGGSSLELGYSHTAQNSLSETAVSEPLDYSVTSAQASAGAYPSRAPSVSLTLDSNSDYVQLPPLEDVPRPSISVTIPMPSLAVNKKPAATPQPPQLVVTRNNYLDVRASGAMTTVYARQISQSQIEQFQQQLCSDLDYVIFPVRDPAISRQEYADHKMLTRILPPPPYCSSKSSHMYRSAPNVQALGATVRLPSFQYGQSNLAALRCLSTHSLSRTNLDNPLPPSRAASDDNLLSPQVPPRPPPRPSSMAPRVVVPPRIPRFPSSHQTTASPPSTMHAAPTVYPKLSLSMPRASSVHSISPPAPPPHTSNSSPAVMNAGTSGPPPSSKLEVSKSKLDIRKLREKSKNLDLPLIQALCNDRSLLRQTREVSKKTAHHGIARVNLFPRGQLNGNRGMKTRQTAHTHPTQVIATPKKSPKSPTESAIADLMAN